MNAAFNRDPVADHYVILDKDVPADVAVPANLRVWKNDTKLPNSSVFSDVARLHVRELMDHTLLKSQTDESDAALL